MGGFVLEDRVSKCKQGILLLFMLQIIATDVFASASCQSGYGVVLNVAQSTFAAPVNNLCKFGGYSLIEIPDDFEPIYNGFVLGNTTNLCDNGHMTGGNCETFSPGVCDTGYDIAAVQSTFTAPVNNLCKFGGYSLIEIPDDFTPVYNGFLMGNEVTLCSGVYGGGSCSGEYDIGDCIEGYYDLLVNVNTFTDLVNGVCSSPYVKYTNTTRCDHNPGGTCVDLPTPVINLTWENNGNTVSENTCIFEEGIVLPSEPVRAGYSFSGWKLLTE